MSRKIYALKVGERDISPINHLYMQPKAPSELVTVMFFWCILDNELGPIIVDNGFSRKALEANQIAFRMDAEPPELLSRININPEEVKHVILTHLHWDHYCGDIFFPNAQYYVQQKELDCLVSPFVRHPVLGRDYKPEAVRQIVDLHLRGKVTILNGDAQLFPGIEGMFCGGHSMGCMSVFVDLPSGLRVITSDLIPRYQNLVEDIPPGIHTNAVEAVLAMNTIRARISSLDALIPGHDPFVQEKYPRIADNVFLVAE